MKLSVRIGHGYDAHRWTEGRPLVLGGVQISHHRGLLGHSDADVAVHAICDAVLGALALGDLGRHFPDSDARFHNISSLELLQRVVGLAAERGWRVGNVDTTIVAQRPRLAHHVPSMVSTLAAVLQVECHQVNVKATTTEGMGFVGREEGVSAHAVVLLVKTPRPRQTQT